MRRWLRWLVSPLFLPNGRIPSYPISIQSPHLTSPHLTSPCAPSRTSSIQGEVFLAQSGGRGFLTREAYARSAGDSPETRAALLTVFEMMDANEDEVVTFSEFLDYTMLMGWMSRGDVGATVDVTFRLLDHNGDGTFFPSPFPFTFPIPVALRYICADLSLSLSLSLPTIPPYHHTTSQVSSTRTSWSGGSPVSTTVERTRGRRRRKPGQRSAT